MTIFKHDFDNRGNGDDRDAHTQIINILKDFTPEKFKKDTHLPYMLHLATLSVDAADDDDERL